MPMARRLAYGCLATTGVALLLVFALFSISEYGPLYGPLNRLLGNEAVDAPSFAIMVRGTPGTAFKGIYTTTTLGESSPITVEGVIPAEFNGKGTVTSASFQRMSGSGTLTLVIEGGESAGGTLSVGGRSSFEVEASADGIATWPKP